MAHALPAVRPVGHPVLRMHCCSPTDSGARPIWCWRRPRTCRMRPRIPAIDTPPVIPSWSCRRAIRAPGLAGHDGTGGSSPAPLPASGRRGRAEVSLRHAGTPAPPQLPYETMSLVCSLPEGSVICNTTASTRPRHAQISAGIGGYARLRSGSASRVTGVIRRHGMLCVDPERSVFVSVDRPWLATAWAPAAGEGDLPPQCYPSTAPRAGKNPVPPRCPVKT